MENFNLSREELQVLVSQAKTGLGTVAAVCSTAINVEDVVDQFLTKDSSNDMKSAMAWIVSEQIEQVKTNLLTNKY